ncbi:TPA: oxidoreductase [Vibrio vulnificus]|uniref:oxidoreductase n=2 Tax=Vibrio TaxID=662 RepID=UPI001594A2AA|nr:oxidoreductase [Vibrio sp. 05-20-BW147]HAS6097984.1 oxidoreductase [Vibrio vulnificus]NVC64344.1 oxidoreductase [Vibrio sp. 05-20-BW147]HAS6346583.1 oxidoreductase [Vibrio vulnificus]HDY7752922.1 oxidoreductase [Vibrio vulnificus]HDY8119467.1 oxidoreductase [Vibrio vulnificus]
MRCFALFLSLFLAPFAHSESFQIQLVDALPIEVTIQDLEKMEATLYVTELPWVNEPTEFTGVKLSTILTKYYGFIPPQVTIRALNDYAADVKKEDIEKYQPIIAYWQNGKPMKIRDKGPFWLIYPQSSFPKELNFEYYHAQMVWQINQIYIAQ